MRTTGLARFIAVSLLAHAAAALVIAPWPGREATEPSAAHTGTALAVRLAPAGSATGAPQPRLAERAEPAQAEPLPDPAPTRTVDAVTTSGGVVTGDRAEAIPPGQEPPVRSAGLAEERTGEPLPVQNGAESGDVAETKPRRAAAKVDEGSHGPEVPVADTAEPPMPGRLADRLREAVETHFHYPALARRRGMEGEVVIGLRVEGDGRLTAIRVVSSSGHRLLDHAAIESLTRAARLADARGVPDGGVELTLPVRYLLVDA